MFTKLSKREQEKGCKNRKYFFRIPFMTVQNYAKIDPHRKFCAKWGQQHVSRFFCNFGRQVQQGHAGRQKCGSPQLSWCCPMNLNLIPHHWNCHQSLGSCYWWYQHGNYYWWYQHGKWSHFADLLAVPSTAAACLRCLPSTSFHYCLKTLSLLFQNFGVLFHAKQVVKHFYGG